VSLEAVQHVRRMRGGAQAHLIRCSDGNLYVVKFRNNPQHLRILANEMLATKLAQEAALPVPVCEVIEVNEWLIESTTELKVQMPHCTVQCVPGEQFGSRYVVDPTLGQVFDYIPVEMLRRVKHLEIFAGILAFDKWVGNVDARQVAFWRVRRQQSYIPAFIDHGYCFNGGEWTFPDNPLRGVYPDNEVYRGISGWNSFDPWLALIEGMPERRIWEIAASIPNEWYADDSRAFRALVSTLLNRRTRIRELIERFRLSARSPFPQWRDETQK
jgi:hypothetical protein